MKKTWFALLVASIAILHPEQMPADYEPTFYSLQKR